MSIKSGCGQSFGHLATFVVDGPYASQLHGQLIAFLQRLSSRVSSHILDLLKINHLMTGNVLQVPDKQFFVDEACSGIVSIMSVIAAGGIYCVWKNRPAIHVILLLVTGVIWAC